MMQGQNEICVPGKALALSGENGEAVEPGQGDTVSLQIEGKITRGDGGMVYVQPTSINGQPVDEVETANDPDESAETMERDFGA